MKPIAVKPTACVLVITCWFMLMNVRVYSQQTSLATTILDSRKGLSNSSVNYLFQDSDNLLWVATWDGLNLYDGSSFHVFNYNISKNTLPSIGNNVIEQITEDANDNIWISTVEGISKFSKATNQFSNFFYSQTPGKPFAERQHRLLTGKQNEIFCLSPRHGFIKYNSATDVFDSVALAIHPSEINEACFDQGDRLWLLMHSGRISILSQQAGKFLPLSSPGFNGDSFKQIFSAGGDILLVDSANQLFVVNRSTLVPENKAQLPAAIRSIALYADHYVIALSGEGFIVLDKNFRRSSFLSKELHFLHTTQINTFITTRDQTLWCGTDGSGIIQVSEPQRKFHTVTNQSLGFLNNKQTRTFLEVNNELWVGTKGNGVLVFDKKGTEMEWKFSRAITAPSQLDNNAVYCLLKASDDMVLIGSDGPGLSIYDLRSKKLMRWSFVKKKVATPHFESVYSILEDKYGTFWIGTSGYGLVHIKLLRTADGFCVDVAEQFRYTGNNNGPANDIIFSIIADSRGNLLLACRYGGLSIFNRQKKHFNNIKAFQYEGGLTHNDILSLYRDRKNQVWIGTSFGLNKIREDDLYTAQPKFQQFSVNTGLLSNTIHGIVEDDAGYTWVTTNNGIARFGYSNNEIVKYSDRDGLQSNEFSDGAIWKNKDGMLYFGGIYGFSYCKPEQIHITGTQPNLLISEFKLGNAAGQQHGFWILPVGKKTVPPEYSTSKSNNFFDLKLKAIDFANAEKCEYAYKLEGYDQQWHFSGNNGNISYANLPPGIYSLKVKWSNGDSKWTAEVKALDITVQQHFLLTFPAFLLYYLLVATGGYMLYSNRKHKLQMQRQLALEQQLRAKEEQVHYEKINFFTNIAHELQTPVTLMMGSLETHGRNEERDKTPFLSLVKQQAARLTYLVQQLLEFRKAEDGHLKKELSTIHFTNLLSSIAFLFYENKDQKRFRFEISIENGMTGIADKDKLEKIIYNLLSNAFKHSPPGEEISFRAGRREKNLWIEVANSGINLTKQETERLFDKFFTQSDITQRGFSTGIGLTFTRQLVSVLGGTISAGCEANRIIFTVILPVQFEDESDDPGSVHETPSELLQSIVENTVSLPEVSLQHNKQSLLEDVSGGEKPVALVVDDDAAIRFLLREILRPAYIVYEAVNGREGLEWLAKHKADIIISDIMMPGMSGLDFCEAIKNAPDTCHIPVVLLSARGSVDHQTEGYEAGADAYIPKPFNTQHLLTRMLKLLERRKQLEELLKNNVFQIEENAGVHADDKRFLINLVEYIGENIDDTGLNAVHLEKHCLLSKMQLYRKLKTLSGMSPGEFIRHVRLQKAAQLLQASNLSVAEIFYQTGFNNQSYFFREFKKYFQCSPGEYRESRRLKL